MARYKLGIYNRKELKVLELDKIVKLEKLRNLDEFTTKFNNEIELKVYLLNKGVISSEDLNKNISVIYKHNGEIKKLPIFYSDTKKYLDIHYLRYQLKKLSGRLDFIEKLANHYSNGSTKFNKQGLNISDIRIYLGDVRRTGEGDPILLETAITDLLEKEIFKERNYDTGEIKEDYRRLRNLALFIYRFKQNIKKNELVKKQNISEEIGVQTTLFEQIEEYNEKKWTLSSEGDPDFPFNSEEEKMYLKYLDELDTPISSDIEERISRKK